MIKGKILIRIILIILILLSGFLLIIINASSHRIDIGTKLAPLIAIVVFVVLFFLTKHIKQKN